MDLMLLSAGLLAALTLWWWLIAIVRPWSKVKSERWLWRKVGGSGNPPT